MSLPPKMVETDDANVFAIHLMLRAALVACYAAA
jgi:hypothetical protein